MPAGDGVSPAGAVALDELFASQAGAVANLQALLTSVERASGARLAGSKAWERRQLAAADRFASAAADRLERELRLRESARTELERGGLQSRTITGADAYASEEQLARGNPPLEEEELGSRDGTPEPFRSVFDQLKTPLAARVHFRASALFAAPPESPESVIGHFPDDLTDPGVLDAVREAAAALRSFARGI